MTPTRYDNQGTWNAAVESGASREERAARLAEVPVAYRQAVKRHVEVYFRIKAAKDRAAHTGGKTLAPKRKG